MSAGASGAVSVAPALLQLRAQLDAAYPQRNRASDGGLPSAAHHAANPTSDHETGAAYDFTYDPEHGPDLDGLAVALLADPRAHYVIWNGQIANPEIQGGAWRAYTGASPHREHLHLSIYPAKRDDASPWDLTLALPWVFAKTTDGGAVRGVLCDGDLLQTEDGAVFRSLGWGSELWTQVLAARGGT